MWDKGDKGDKGAGQREQGAGATGAGEGDGASAPHDDTFSMRQQPQQVGHLSRSVPVPCGRYRRWVDSGTSPR
jgi:hypothetical protein